MDCVFRDLPFEHLLTAATNGTSARILTIRNRRDPLKKAMEPGGVFSLATRVESLGEEFAAEIHEGWDIAGNANGGYLMSMAARAMSAISRPHPVCLTAHFLRPGKPGPVRIRPVLIKDGRRLSTVRASVLAGDKSLLELLGSFGNLADIEGPVRVDAQPPKLPRPEDCVRLNPVEQGFPSPFNSRLDLRLHPDDSHFLQGKPSGSPLFRGWLRLHDEPVDSFGLLTAVDAFPPTIFNANLPVAWTPTIEMTAHIRRVPESGWLRCRFSTRFITGGMLEEDGDIWDESDRLVAQSRQLALQPRG